MNSASGINPEMEGGNRTTTKIYSHFYICKLCSASLSLVSGHKPGKRSKGGVEQRVERQWKDFLASSKKHYGEQPGWLLALSCFLPFFISCEPTSLPDLRQ